MRHIALALLFSLVLVGCSDSDAQEVADAPWIVTGTSFVLPEADRISLSVTYTAPHGRDGEWVLSVEPSSGFADSSPFKCWKQARIGEPIPDCLRDINSPQP